ncbi:MAG: DUF3488 and transglutaminase-like domain-containing protein [Ilumatobacteraceae bacterium]
MSVPRRPLPLLERDLGATAALALYGLAVAVGFARVFGGWAFLTDLGVLVVLGHGLSLVLRRARVPGWLAIPGTTAVLLWALTALHYADTMTAFVPRGATRDQIGLEVGLVRDQFQTAVAPVLYGAGWATLAGFAVIICIVMADSFAFRAEARGEALVPGAVLFVFIAALGSPRLRIVTTVLLIATGVLAVIALRWLHDRTRRVELSTARRPAPLAVPAAIGTALAIAVLAGVVGPRLPGAQAEPLYQTRGRNGGVTEVISPLVDIRSRLTNGGEIELIRVNADAPSYWRATTLPEFDGRTFRLPTRSLERVDGAFGDAETTDRQIRQQVQVLSLGGKLVPAAADPYQAEGDSGGRSVDLRLNRDTNTLVTPDELSPGDTFLIVSSAPELTPEVLRAAGSASPPDPVFLGLPDDLPAVVGDLARQVTAGQPTSYDEAIALQNWFRTEFRYSLEVQSGHGNSAIASFLDERVGYCEQFAASFAAMARTLGIPTRVAVGFTPGVLNADGFYSVLGRNAHAWPEVWFDGIGWVPFEPTPGRGAPGAESYTDIAAQQDETPADPDPNRAIDPDAPPTPTAPATVVPPRADGAGAATSTTVAPRPVGNAPLPDGGIPADATGSTTRSAPSDGGTSVPWTLIIVALIAALLAGGPWLIRRVVERRARLHGPAERVHLAWASAVRSAQIAGVRGTAAMTPREWAQATSGHLAVASRPMRSLAEVVDQITFAPPDRIDLERTGALGDTLGRDCELWSEQIGRIANDTLTRSQRIRRYYLEWT